MSFEFILFILLAIVTVIALLVRRKTKKNVQVLQEVYSKSDQYEKGSNKKKLDSAINGSSLATGSFVSFSALALLSLVFAVFYTVPVRNVGIVTSFNKPTGETTGSGLHPVLPWQRVADFDASIQPSLHLGDWGHGCITVRIGSLATACVETRIQWQVVESSAPK